MTDKIFDLIEMEESRQSNTLMMIPSENYTYPEVRRAVGSVLMHKYAEGQPGKRYYQKQCYDETENTGRKGAKGIWFSIDDWSVNVQPH
jgi:glycine hydroxymethyltransferase